MKKDNKKIVLHLETKLPRGKMPSPTKVYVDKKKKENKNKCCKNIRLEEE